MFLIYHLCFCFLPQPVWTYKSSYFQDRSLGPPLKQKGENIRLINHLQSWLVIYIYCSFSDMFIVYRPCQGAVILYLAVHSTMMAQYMRTRYAAVPELLWPVIIIFHSIFPCTLYFNLFIPWILIQAETFISCVLYVDL